MFCKKCGKELPDESQFCPFCMTKFTEEKEENPIDTTAKAEAPSGAAKAEAPAEAKAKKPGKKPIIIAVAAILVIAIVVCAIVIPKSKTSEADENEGSDSASFTTGADLDPDNKTITTGKKKSVEKDDDLGLMNVKIQDTDSLSDIEKLIVRYFDNDYFDTPVYEALRRYPKVYKGAQISFLGVITKTIESDDESYTFLCEYGYDSGDYIVVKGAQEDTRMIEGDNVYFYGKYTGIDSYTVDGTSYSVPTVLVNKHLYAMDNDCTAMYSAEQIKSIAQYLFGKDINVRYTKNSDFPDPDAAADYDYEIYEGCYYTVEPENQSNSNFTKYMFWASKWGKIYDLKAEWPEERDIIFAADFEHFYVKIFNHDLKTFSIACYDLDLNKEWQRDFDETTTAVLDYTASHMYLVANGYMYIIDTETGEDAVEKKYVGAKVGIRKLEDGILLISGDTGATGTQEATGGSDAFMKTDLSGNVLWTANAKDRMYFPEYVIIQIVDGNYVAVYESFSDSGYGGQNSIVVSPDGEVLFEGQITTA